MQKNTSFFGQLSTFKTFICSNMGYKNFELEQVFPCIESKKLWIQLLSTEPGAVSTSYRKIMYSLASFKEKSWLRKLSRKFDISFHTCRLLNNFTVLSDKHCKNNFSIHKAMRFVKFFGNFQLTVTFKSNLILFEILILSQSTILEVAKKLWTNF